MKCIGCSWQQIELDKQHSLLMQNSHFSKCGFLGVHLQTNANVLGTDCQRLQGNKSISMVNLGARDKRVLKMTICKGSDSEDVQRIIAFAYLLINPLAVFMCKGQDHCVMVLNHSCYSVFAVYEVSECSFASVYSSLCPRHTSSFSL